MKSTVITTVSGHVFTYPAVSPVGAVAKPPRH